MRSGKPRLLTINSGSSSIKFALFETGESLTRIYEGRIERIGRSDSTFRFNDFKQSDGWSRKTTAPDHRAAVGVLLDWLDENESRSGLVAIGHRVVNGGPKFYAPQRITDPLMDEIRRIGPFDPEHAPAEILLIEEFQRRFPDLAQFACFDTGFHRDLPRVARLLAIPRRYEARGVRRYGFHGLSYESVLRELNRTAGTEIAHGKVILAHLGSGASLAAVSAGKSVETSMGFSPSSGVPMGTRSGDLDPGLVSYLMLTEGIDIHAFDKMMNEQSGLLGVSETSSDMQDLLRSESNDARAADAVALFCYQVKKCIGAFATVLGGLDTLVFSGGIGENSPVVRARICEGLDFLGIDLDENANGAGKAVVSRPNGRILVRVIRADEEQTIARAVSSVLGQENK